ncbi:hypothetical protein BT63DRAFT_451561 [Microthyrium microscopicum]|uniref:RRM domain-containing protein n=1 Tax=Microthyrium microscopicum TaxID=703497 RepID=A0A6A6UMP9_9PEZI|nr:hypothetical protein BT63DRAFT_451561 [Microthyrium microscopicum]
MDSSVTIAKPYFEALLPLHLLHPDDDSNGVPLPGLVTIPQVEYQSLQASHHEYQVLKRALFKGGLRSDTLETLLKSEDSDDGYEQVTISNYMVSEPKTERSPPDTLDESDGTSNYVNIHNQRRHSGYGAGRFSGGQSSQKEQVAESRNQSGRDRNVRTLFFTNLSDKTTHKDLTHIVRGGRLLDIHLRHDNCAAIAFVEGAAEFLAYSKRNDIYIHGKRVEVRWAERQFHIPEHVSHKLSQGASRNLVIRGGAGKLTEDGIREDMEHIHNLVVIDVKTKGKDVFISTNSVHNALFARTCMMSRQPYKGCRIEWNADECAEPIPKPVSTYISSNNQPTAKSAPVRNMFELLTLDGAEDDEDEQSFEPGMSWADSSLIAA